MKAFLTGLFGRDAEACQCCVTSPTSGQACGWDMGRGMWEMEALEMGVRGNKRAQWTPL